VGDDLRPRTPRWLSPVTLALALVGLGVSIYLTVEHFSGATHLAGCTVGGAVDCGAVTTSRWSHFLGIPVSVLGLVYFVLAVPFLTPWAWRSRTWFWRWGRQGGAVLGLVSVVYLLYAELGRVHKICEYCTSVHLITLVLFAVITYGTIATSVPVFDGDQADQDDERDQDDEDDETAPAALSAD